MLFKKIVLLVLIAIATQAKAQNYFDSVYQIKGDINSAGWSILPDSNFYIVCGFNTDSPTQYLNYFIAKIDSTGQRVWEKTYGELTGQFYYPGTNSLIKTTDNNYAITLVQYSNIIQKFRIWLLKIDYNGDTLWTKRYTYNHYNEVYQCKQAPDNGFFIIGASDSTDYGHADMTLIKTDSLGNFEWQKFYHKTGIERAYSFDTLCNGDLIIGGWRSNSFVYAEVLRVDSAGNVKWNGTYGTTWGNAGTAIKCLRNGDYIIGYSSGISYDGGVTTYYRLRLARLNNFNQILWDKPYGHLMLDGCSTTIIENTNGDVVVSGIEADSVTYHVRAFLLMIDSLGTQKVFNYYEHLPDVNAQNYLYDVKKTNDKGYVATGFCTSPIDPQYCWIVKVDSMGCQIPGCNVGVEEVESRPGVIKIFPNPATSGITLEMPQMEHDAELVIFNTLGEVIVKMKVCKVHKVESEVKVDVGMLPAGLYFVKMNKHTGKFVKQN